MHNYFGKKNSNEEYDERTSTKTTAANAWDDERIHSTKENAQKRDKIHTSQIIN